MATNNNPTETKTMKNTELTEAILALSHSLDPDKMGVCWPDPIAWDGRALTDQAADLADLGGAQLVGRSEYEIESSPRLWAIYDAVVTAENLLGL